MASLIMKVKASLKITSNATTQVIITFSLQSLVILRRFENDVIFEELGHWNGMEAMANYVIGNMMAVVHEKNGIIISPN